MTLLARILSLQDYGNFQVSMYFVAISIYIFGLEYYMLGNRDVILLDRKSIISSHVSFTISVLPVTILIQLVSAVILVPNSLISWNLLLIFVIGFSEFVSQEVFRYLIMIQKITWANLLLVFKSSSLLALVLIYYWVVGASQFQQMLILYFVSHSLLLILSMALFHIYILPLGQLELNVYNFKHIKETFRRILPFIYLMISIKGIEYVDKFLITKYQNLDDVAIYSYMFSIAMLSNVFIVSGIYLIYLPYFIKMSQESHTDIRPLLKKFSKLLVLSTIVLGILILVFIGPLLDFVGKQQLTSSIDLLIILLIAISLANIALIPQIVIYSLKKDNILLKIGLSTFIVNLALNIFLIPNYGIYGAAYALVITYLLKNLSSYIYLNKLWPKNLTFS